MDKIKFAKVRETAIIPTKRKEDGCYDIYINTEQQDFVIPPFTVKLCPTGIASVFDDKYRISVRERGSNTKSTLIVMAGQIDSNYRGEYFVALYNGNSIPVTLTSAVDKVIKHEDYIEVPQSKAIAQLAVEFVPQVEVEEVTYEELLRYESNRGIGALGSSGK